MVGAAGIAADADRLAERLGEGRFYVVCVGQFKRGKSTLLNALAGVEVLPTGVLPVTTTVTVLRHGPEIAARLRFATGDWQPCPVAELFRYVSEEENPGNAKGITAVEVFVPARLLADGMCLVDTPGLGSVYEANTRATRAFVPHIDAALVILGADPPISGEELALIEDVARQIEHVIVVLNKSDRTTDVEREQAARFTERVLADKLGRAPGPIFHVSATARLRNAAEQWDWPALVERLESLARESGADLVRSAEQRGIASLTSRLRHELDEREGALRRPLAESQAKVERLRSAATTAEHALEDLGHRLLAVEARLVRRFTEERDRFFGKASAEAQHELHEAMRGEPGRGAALRRRAEELAMALAQRWLERWRRDEEPRAQALYRDAVERFVQLVDGVRADLVGAGLAVPVLGADTGFQAKSGFRYHRLLTIAPASGSQWLLDVLTLGSRRLVERDAGRYLDRLLEVNSARIANDFRERLLESREALERQLRDALRELLASAERATERAARALAAGAEAVAEELRRIAALRSQVDELRTL